MNATREPALPLHEDKAAILDAAIRDLANTMNQLERLRIALCDEVDRIRHDVDDTQEIP